MICGIRGMMLLVEEIPAGGNNYSVIRIFVEHFRADKLIYFENISSAQSVGIIGIILSFVLMFVLKRKKIAPMESS